MCTDPAFKKYRAMSGKDLLLFYSTIGRCLDWGALTASQLSIVIQAQDYDRQSNDTL